jgi:DNA-binding MarR family transcriptional regulator
MYEIAERWGWNAEEVYNMVKRLEDDGLIRTDESEEEEKRKRKVFSERGFDFVNLTDTSILILHFKSGRGVSNRWLSVNGEVFEG